MTIHFGIKHYPDLFKPKGASGELHAAWAYRSNSACRPQSLGFPCHSMPSEGDKTINKLTYLTVLPRI